MAKALKHLKYYSNIKWISRMIGFLTLASFLILYYDEVFRRSFEWHYIVAILFIVPFYLVGLMLIFNNNLLNGIISITNVIFLQVILFFSYPDASIITTYMLMVPGGFIIFMHLLTAKQFLNSDINLRNLEQKYSITLNMMEINPDILANENLDDILQKILEKAVSILSKVQKGSILIRHGEIMKFHAAVGYDLASLQKIELKLEEMFQYKLGVINEPSIMQNIKEFNKQNVEKEKWEMFVDSNSLVAKSTLTCPIRLHGRIYGFINLDNVDIDDAFDENDKIYIKHLATQIDIALNNHLLVQDIYRLSRYDSLTGANTRRYNSELMNKVKQVSNLEHKKFSVCVLDINNLKPVNDQYGHDAGDQYLVHFSDITQKSIAKDVIFSRTGGDEFILTFPQMSKDKAIKKLELLRQKLKENPLVYNDITIPLNFGFGVAEYPTDSEEISDLIQMADVLMYENKDKIKKIDKI